MRIAGLLASIVCLNASAQQPRISNSTVEPLQVEAGFSNQFEALVRKQQSPAWFGYVQAAVDGNHNSCCYDSSFGRGCGLEGRPSGPSQAGNSTPVRLEGSKHVTVLFRVAQGAVERIRTFSLDCDLDAGGLPFRWFNGVTAQQSLRLLSSYIPDTENDGRDQRKLSESAVTAIALHAGNEAGSLLEKYAAAGRPEQQRRSAIFWLANNRGTRGFEVVDRIAREDATDKVREHAIFALTLNKDPRAIESIIQIAKNDKVPHVRGQALFWLAQKAGSKAAGAIAAAIENDPETKVKEKAVFALSQLPKEQGVPLLIEQARKNRNPAVRKQAVFWLGQSKDARALAFLEEILAK